MFSNLAELCTVKGNQKISKEPQFEVSNPKNKDLVQQCTFQKVWKIALSTKTRFFLYEMDKLTAVLMSMK